MTAYVLRRLLYALPILIGVNVITFSLFFVVNTPEDMARMHLGQKHVTEAAIEKWKRDRGYDRPLLWNDAAPGVGRATDTVFFDESVRLFVFDFGVSDAGRDIGYDVRQRMWPSLAVTVPLVIIALLVQVSFALFLAFLRATSVELAGVVLCVALMSVSGLFYYIGGQFVIGRLLRLAPISGFGDGLEAAKFVAMPVLVAVLAGTGAATRFYRTVFLEELGKDFVRTARAKGLSEGVVMFRHVLGNALIPILTTVVAHLPALFLGALILESIFAIPGLGSYTLDGINGQDFAIVRSMVFLGSVLYIAGLILTDLSYTLADPCVRLE